VNPFRAIARVASSPARLVRQTARLLTLRDRAEDVLALAQDAEVNPQRYRDATWWSRLVTAGGRLAAALPLAPEVRTKMQTYLLKAGVVLGAVGGFAGYLADQGILQLLPAKYAATIGVVCGAAATAAAYLHPAPSAKQ
jgi:hypothetical protein